MKRGLLIGLFLILLLIVGCFPAGRSGSRTSLPNKGFENFQESLEQIEQEQECVETRILDCSSIQGAMKIGNKDGFLKYHCNNLYFIEFPDPESGIGGESVLAENIEGDKYDLFGETIEVKPEEDCTLIMNTDEEATGTDFEFGGLDRISKNINNNVLTYFLNGVKHRVIAIREVRLSKYVGLSSEFSSEDPEGSYINNFDVGFDGGSGTFIFTAKDSEQSFLGGRIGVPIIKSSENIGFPVVGTIYAPIEKDGYIWIKFKEL